jgi:hypothetical protein
MTSPSNPSLSTNKNAPTRKDNRPVKTVASRLKEAGLGTKRFLPIGTGEKGTNSRHDCVSIEEVRNEPIYGVYADKGDDLVLIDIDSYRCGNVPESVENLPATFTVRSPHRGRHLYYTIAEDIKGAQLNWGEIRTNNQYVVGPGSQLQKCSKDWHDCSQPDEGQYKIIEDRPIHSIEADTINTLLCGRNSNSTVGVQNSVGTSRLLPTGNDNTQAKHEFSVEKRQEKMMNSKRGKKIEKLWKGRYQEAGYEDRSTAEAALVSYLGFWMGGNQPVVRRLMNEACEEYPEADVNGRRKWVEAREVYRNNTLQLAKLLHYYQPESPAKPYEERPKVSWVTENLVFLALWELEPARTSEIAAHNLVDRGERQVRNCLNELIDQGVIGDKKDGRKHYYKIAYSIE